MKEKKKESRKKKPKRGGAAAEIRKTVEALRKVPPADFILMIVTACLMIFGVIMIFSSSYYWSMDKYGKPYGYLIKAVVWAVAGAMVMFVTSHIDYRIYRKFHRWIMVISIVLLFLIFTPLGHEAGGAVRWLDLKVITIMPGEIAKIAVIIYTSAFLARRDINDLKGTVLPLLVLAGLCGGLIMLQPNMSTAATVVMIIIALIFVAGVKWRYLAGLVGIGLAAAVPLMMMGYRRDRVFSFLDPFADPLGDSFQVVQSLLALGSGGLFGRGLGNSLQKNLYLPEPMNDFILAIIGEELGFIGIICLIIAFSLFVWRGIKISLAAPDRFGFFMASGITMLVGIQFAMNIAIVTSSMPPTGIALPFVSYGGNAMLMFCAGTGILLNISRAAEKERKKAEVMEAAEERRKVNRFRDMRGIR